MKPAIPPAVLTQHSAFLGKTGSGKTSTAKIAVEQILADDPSARVCVLDPIKSDWWGLTSSADGRRPGLPFHILGGPRGHVPLHPSAGKAIGELVATGALPLSIIDMADFPAGGLQEFFNDFAPALMKKMRGVVHLVLEEAHEFAPKERANFAGESMAIHNAKKLATAGRSKGIRLMVLTQRTQALHNALLGSCDTLVAHRLTAPADQKPVKDWLKANVSKEIFEQVSSSLASLKTGTGWLCSGEAQVAELVHFPKITTYDNSATPTAGSGDHDVRTAPVDVEHLREIIGEAEAIAEADDPRRLRAEIARLTALTKSPAGEALKPSTEFLEAAERRGYDAARMEISRSLVDRVAEFGREVQHELHIVEGNLISGLANIRIEVAGSSAPPASRNVETYVDSIVRAPGLHVPVLRPTKPAPSKEGPIGGVQQAILNSVAEMEVLCKRAPARVLVALQSGYKNVKSAGFAKAMSTLSSEGYVSYPDPGTVALTDAGRKAARPRAKALTTGEVHARATEMLGETAGRILSHLIKAYPGVLERGVLAEKAGYQNVKSAGFAKAVSRLSTLGFVRYPSSGTAKAGEILFP